jgi:endonuclease-8
VPEGDTYAKAAHRARNVLAGAVVTAVEGSAKAIRRHSPAILDRKVEAVRTVGKNLLIDFDSGLTVRIHLGMNGTVQVTPPGRDRDLAGVRLGLRTDRGAVWAVGAPKVEVGKRAAIDGALARLGPDLLADEFDVRAFEERAGRYPPDRPVCDFLLDQRVMAGVGNVYKSEVLFLERLAPDRTMATIDAATRRRLAERARRLMLPNTRRYNRSTRGLGDGSLWVYGRAGKPCRRCRTEIQEGWLGTPARITYWCPSCQQ